MSANWHRAHMDGDRFGLKRVWLDEVGDQPFRLEVAVRDANGMHAGYGPDMTRQFAIAHDGRVVGVDNNYRGWSLSISRVWIPATPH